jgi:ribokinase
LRAKEKGVRVILNPAPASDLSADLLRGVYLITPNETEASILAGIEVDGPNSARLAGQKLLEMGVEEVVITLGSQGALWVSKDGTESIKTPVVKAVDTTAAGDCFNGALAVAIADKTPMREAISRACKAAAISVTRLGAQASMPFKHELTL